VVGIVFSTTFGFPNNAYATCINTIQSQAIAAAYNGDETPTVHTMDTCGGDDTSYQIPIATTITFDGVEYSNIYATTNSVITFGGADNTYWDYPSTPSISLYSMDWVSGWYNAPDTLNIMYSEGGFQIDLEVIPFGQWGTPDPSNINIIVAITNTGGISVAYSYQGPEYPNLRTGVRLHSGQVISLEAWGATEIQSGSSISLPAEPISGPIAGPTEEPITAEEQQAVVVEAVTLANEIASLNDLIASINEEDLTPEPQPSQDPTPDPEPSDDPTPDPEPSDEPTTDPDLPEPDVEVDPEIITPEDPRFPDDEQTEPKDPNPSPSPDTTDGESTDPSPEPEPSEEPTPEPSPQPTDIDPSPTPEPDLTEEEQPLFPAPDNDNTAGSVIPISEEELNKLNKLIGINDAKLAAELSSTLASLSIENKKEVAEDLGINPEEISLIAETMKDNPSIAVAVVEFADRAEENKDAAMPYTLADAVAEVKTEQLLEDPLGTLASVFTGIDTEILLSPSEWGKDMTDDQREKIQEIVVSVIIASNIVSVAMTRRIG
jgi:hypothetical protein